MTQVVSNKTGRKKIVKALGENTEIKITAKKFTDYLEIRTELKLNPEHKFRDEYSISLQPYESKGFARQPMDMGTVGNPSDLSFNLDDISYDTLLFRLKVVDKNNTVKGFADEIKPDLSGGGNDTSDGGDGSNTILPIKEDSSIKLPFAIQMEPNTKPVLLVKSKLNLKEQFKHDIRTKVFIYTSVIRQILINYLSDNSYEDCAKKKIFLSKVLGNAGLEDDHEIPKYYNDDGSINQEATDWIEETTAACIDTPVIFKGNKTNYLSLFEKKCKEAVVEEENEN